MGACDDGGCGVSLCFSGRECNRPAGDLSLLSPPSDRPEKEKKAALRDLCFLGRQYGLAKPPPPKPSVLYTVTLEVACLRTCTDVLSFARALQLAQSSRSDGEESSSVPCIHVRGYWGVPTLKHVYTQSARLFGSLFISQTGGGRP